MVTTQMFQESVQRDRELDTYGCTIAEFKELIEDSMTFQTRGPAACAFSLMSDAQTEMQAGLTGHARQTLNRAKWILSNYVLDTLKL